MTRKQKQSKRFTYYNKAASLDSQRARKALSLVQSGKVRVLDAYHGKVQSQTRPDVEYDVWANVNGHHPTPQDWHCNCPDHLNRHLACGHIFAFWMESRTIGRPQTMPKPARRPTQWANGEIARMRQQMRRAA